MGGEYLRVYGFVKGQELFVHVGRLNVADLCCPFVTVIELNNQPACVIRACGFALELPFKHPCLFG